MKLLTLIRKMLCETCDKFHIIFVFFFFFLCFFPLKIESDQRTRWKQSRIYIYTCHLFTLTFRSDFGCGCRRSVYYYCYFVIVVVAVFNSFVKIALLSFRSLWIRIQFKSVKKFFSLWMKNIFFSLHLITSISQFSVCFFSSSFSVSKAYGRHTHDHDGMCF